MPAFDPFNAPLLQLLGIVGALIYIANYIMLTARYLTPEMPLYFLGNLVAATLILFSLGHAFHSATLIIQVFFVCVSTVGILSRLPPDRRAQRSSRNPACPFGRGVQSFRI